MEETLRTLNSDLLMEEIKSLLPLRDTVPLVVSGNSMSPFLVHHRDTVYLSQVTEPLRRGDIALYQRDNGAYVLHRIYAVKNGTYDMVGDGQTEIEHGIRAEQIFAVVRFATRKEKKQGKGCFWWEFFSKFWIRTVALRHYFIGIYRMFGRKK